MLFLLGLDFGFGVFCEGVGVVRFFFICIKEEYGWRRRERDIAWFGFGVGNLFVSIFMGYIFGDRR